MSASAPVRLKQQHEGSHAAQSVRPQSTRDDVGSKADVMSLQRNAGNSSVNAFAGSGAGSQRDSAQIDSSIASAPLEEAIRSIPKLPPDQVFPVLKRYQQFIVRRITTGEGRIRDAQLLRAESFSNYLIGGTIEAFGGTSLPSGDWEGSWQYVNAAYGTINKRQVKESLVNLNVAAEATNRRWEQLNEYLDQTEKGADRSVFALQVMQAAGAVAATALTGGGATAIVVGAGYGAAQNIAGQATSVSIGIQSEIDWGGMAFDTLFGVLTGALGGKLGNAVLKKLMGNKTVASLGRRVVSEVVSDLVSGRMSSLLQTIARSLFDQLRNKENLTVEEFMHRLADQLMDPKAMLLDAIMGRASKIAHASSSKAPQKTDSKSKATASETATKIAPHPTVETMVVDEAVTKVVQKQAPVTHVEPRPIFKQKVDAKSENRLNLQKGPVNAKKIPTKETATSEVPELTAKPLPRAVTEGGGAEGPAKTMVGSERPGKQGGVLGKKAKENIQSHQKVMEEEIKQGLSPREVQPTLAEIESRKQDLRYKANKKGSKTVGEPVRSLEQARKLYDEVIAKSSGKHEVGIWLNTEDGTYVVRLGQATDVSGPPTPEGVWHAVQHYHTNEPDIPLWRMPARADIQETRNRVATHPLTEFVEYPLPGGKRGRAAFTVHPDGSVRVEFVDVAGKPQELTFKSGKEYNEYYESHKVAVTDPKMIEALKQDADRALGKTSEQPLPSGAKSMVGDIPKTDKVPASLPTATVVLPSTPAPAMELAPPSMRSVPNSAPPIKVTRNAPSATSRKPKSSNEPPRKGYFGGGAGKRIRKGMHSTPLAEVEKAPQLKIPNVKPSTGLSTTERSMVKSAELAVSRLGKPLKVKTKAAPEEGKVSRSGFGKNGGGKERTQKVLNTGKEIGHDFAKNTSLDEGIPGQEKAAHAEKLAAIDSPGKALAVDRTMCPDCVNFFKKLAQARGVSMVVQEPTTTWVFRPDGVLVGLPLGSNLQVVLHPDGSASAGSVP